MSNKPKNIPKECEMGNLLGGCILPPNKRKCDCPENKPKILTCNDCGKLVECPKHGNEEIDEYQHDMDNSWYYSCGKCVVEDGLGLGSIIHWCKELDSFKKFKGVTVTKNEK